MNTDTPLPPDEPAGQNPPDGAIIDYWLKAAARSRSRSRSSTAAGRSCAASASDDPPEPPVEGRNIPDYWIRPPQALSAGAGHAPLRLGPAHETPAAASFGYPIAAIHRNTPREPRGPWVLPGTYTVRLTVDGRVLEQPVTVAMDPRVKTPAADIEAQHAVSMRLCDAMSRAHAALAGSGKPAPGDALGQLQRLHRQLTQLLDTVEDVDALPTPAVQKAVDETIAALDGLTARREEKR